MRHIVPYYALYHRQAPKGGGHFDAEHYEIHVHLTDAFEPFIGSRSDGLKLVAVGIFPLEKFSIFPHLNDDIGRQVMAAKAVFHNEGTRVHRDTYASAVNLAGPNDSENATLVHSLFKEMMLYDLEHRLGYKKHSKRSEPRLIWEIGDVREKYSNRLKKNDEPT